MNQWMNDLSSKHRELPLNKLAIPGSHNSFSYDLDASQPAAPDLDPGIKQIASVLPMVKTTIMNWSVDQKLSVGEQLNSGIRYFDCRIGFDHKSGDHRFLHGLWGPKVIVELRIVKQFIDNHPSELVLIDFNHFYDMTDENHVILVAELTSLFGESLISFNEFSSEGCVEWNKLTLENLSANYAGKQVILFYASDTGVALSDLSFWPHSTLIAPWPRSKDSNEMIKFHDEKFENIKHGCGKFYVSQGIITPDGGMIMKNLTKNFYDQFACQTTQSFCQWMTKKFEYPRHCNIFIADAVEHCNFIETVLSLNK